MHFKDLGLSEKLLKAIEEKGYETPTPIQEKAIPAVFMLRDIVGLAQTGTGKTAGFTLPMIEILSGGRAKARMPRSLVLAPTRELAAQVAENFDMYSKYAPLSKVLLVGGEAMGEQTKLLEKGVDVLIATPGRMMDHFERGSILLNDIQILVIDEADRMLDMGFIPDVEKIISLLPPTRQTLLFSATMPKEIERLAGKFLKNPKRVSVAPPASPAKTVEQFLIHVQNPRSKRKQFLDLLKALDIKNAFVFCNRKKDVDGVASWLKKSGMNAKPLHGDMVQAARNKTLQEFKDDEVRFLVCSDIAARGLDVKGVSHVFNYDLPYSAEDYVHRIGRTGRGGDTGKAYSLYYANQEDKLLTAIQKLIGKEIEVFGQVIEKSEEFTRKEDRKQQNRKPDKPHHKTAHHEEEDVTGFGDEIPSFFKV